MLKLTGCLRLHNNIEKRLWFIELLAWWEGKINASILMRHFLLSRVQAQHDIKRYLHLQPNNLTYCASSKGFIPAVNFIPQLISGDVVEYLNWLGQSEHADQTAQLPHHALSLPAREVSAPVIRMLVSAMRQQRRLDVDYVSLSHPDHQGRIITPHHFVKTGLRWHLRAYCEKSAGYRDFVLSRFRGIPDLLDKSQHNTQQDHAWNTEITLILQPDPRLSLAQQTVIAQDYTMQNNQLHIKTRACLAQYLLQELQVNLRHPPISPEAQQLVLVNINEVKPWLFDYKT